MKYTKIGSFAILFGLLAANGISQTTTYVGPPFDTFIPTWGIWFWVLLILITLSMPAYVLFERAMVKKPAGQGSISGTSVRLYHVPGWDLRKIGGDAYAVFSNETGWLGNGLGKYVKDKGDYGLDDRIKEAAPIPPGSAKSFPVRRLPSKNLIVANIYDEKGVSGPGQFAAGFRALISEARALGADTIVLLDPTDDWNYFTERTAAEDVARLLMKNIDKADGAVPAFKIIVTKPEHLAAYNAVLQETSDGIPAESAA